MTALVNSVQLVKHEFDSYHCYWDSCNYQSKEVVGWEVTTHVGMRILCENCLYKLYTELKSELKRNNLYDELLIKDILK